MKTRVGSSSTLSLSFKTLLLFALFCNFLTWSFHLHNNDWSRTTSLSTLQKCSYNMQHPVGHGNTGGLLLNKQHQHRHAGYHSMKPFWKKSSSDDDETNDNDNNPMKEEEDENIINNTSVENELDKMLPSEKDSLVETPIPSKEEHKSISSWINHVGQDFKVKAEKATAKGYQATKRSAKFKYGLKSCLYYSMFILYRAYRGTFVLLPAVFKQVYYKMEATMNSDNLSLEDISTTLTPDDKKEKITWRTKLTVSILATVITISYVIGGITQMLLKFFKTVTRTTSIPKSFEAAAIEIVDHQDRIERVGKINGDNDMEPSGFAP